MNIIGYIGTDAKNIARNAPLKQAIRRKSWLLQTFRPSELNDNIQALLVEASQLNEQQVAPRLRQLPWVLVSSDPADALLAWTLDADYFLLLPLNADTAEQALRRIEIHLKYLECTLKEDREGREGLDINLTKGRRIHVPWSDILYLEADGVLTLIHLRNGSQEKIVATRHLGYWEQRLYPGMFFRVHNKFIVNLTCVIGQEKDQIKMERGSVSIAKRRRKEVERAIREVGSTR